MTPLLPEVEEAQITLADKHRSLSLGGSVMGVLGLAAMVLMGGTTYMFLDYLTQYRSDLEAHLNRIEDKDNAISKARIDRCHEVSEAGANAMEKVANSLDRNSDVLSRVEKQLDNIERGYHKR